MQDWEGESSPPPHASADWGADMTRPAAPIAVFGAARLTEFFEYLDKLRASRTTNMFAAGSLLRAEFGLDRETAGAVLGAWMKSLDGKSAKVRAADVLEWM